MRILSYLLHFSSHSSYTKMVLETHLKQIKMEYLAYLLYQNGASGTSTPKMVHTVYIIQKKAVLSMSSTQRIIV